MSKVTVELNLHQVLILETFGLQEKLVCTSTNGLNSSCRWHERELIRATTGDFILGVQNIFDGLILSMRCMMNMWVLVGVFSMQMFLFLLQLLVMLLFRVELSRTLLV